MTNEYAPEAIRNLRSDLGVTQKGLAHMLGVSTITISAWETGRRPCRGIAAYALTALAREAEKTADMFRKDVDTGTV